MATAAHEALRAENEKLLDLYAAVGLMRDLQRRYFRERSQQILTASKTQEALVDKMIAEMRAPTEPQKAMDNPLFQAVRQAREAVKERRIGPAFVPKEERPSAQVYAAGWVELDRALTVVCDIRGTVISAVERKGSAYNHQATAAQIIAIREAQRSLQARVREGWDVSVLNHDTLAVELVLGTKMAGAPFVMKALDLGTPEVRCIPVFKVTADGNPARAVAMLWAQTGMRPVALTR